MSNHRLWLITIRTTFLWLCAIFMTQAACALPADLLPPAAAVPTALGSAALETAISATLTALAPTATFNLPCADCYFHIPRADCYLHICTDRYSDSHIYGYLYTNTYKHATANPNCHSAVLHHPGWRDRQRRHAHRRDQSGCDPRHQWNAFRCIQRAGRPLHIASPILSGYWAV